MFVTRSMRRWGSIPESKYALRRAGQSRSSTKDRPLTISTLNAVARYLLRSRSGFLPWFFCGRGEETGKEEGAAQNLPHDTAQPGSGNHQSTEDSWFEPDQCDRGALRRLGQDRGCDQDEGQGRGAQRTGRQKMGGHAIGSGSEGAGRNS